MSTVGLVFLGLVVGCRAKANRATTSASTPAQSPDRMAFAADGRVILDREAARRSGLLRGGDEFWMPTTSDVQALELQLPAYLQRAEAASAEPRPPWKPPIAPLWKRAFSYRRQYVGLISSHRRIIFGNFFCDDLGEDWRRQVVDTMGGGDCFFDVKYDTKERRFFALFINASK